MGDGRRGGRVLRFAVTGALLVTPLVGCGEDESPEGTETINEPPDPEPELHVNEPPDEPAEEPTAEDTQPEPE